MRGHQRLDLERAEATRDGRLGLGVGVREVEEEGEELEVVAVDVVTERAVGEQGRYRGGEQSPSRVAVVGGPDARRVEFQESRMRDLWNTKWTRGNGRKARRIVSLDTYRRVGYGEHQFRVHFLGTDGVHLHDYFWSCCSRLVEL